MKLIVLLIISVALYCNAIPTLKLVQVIHRPGERTPYLFYPKDPYQSPSEWPDGVGQLNLKGKKRMYKMGLKLASDYLNYTNELCNPRQVYIRSSASERSIESASALFTGFCPPHDRWIWCDEALCKDAAKYWQPIAIQTVDKAKDNILNAFAPCKTAENAVNDIVKSKEVQDYLKENKEFIEKVGEVTGSFKYYNESSTVWSLADIADTVMAEIENGKNMTEFRYKFGKFNQTVFDKLNEILLKSFKWEYSRKQVQRLRAGPLLKELLKNMNNVKDGKENRKIFVYSTHEYMVLALLQALGIYKGTPASYGEGIVLALFNNNSTDYYLKVLFIQHENDTSELKPIKLPNCSNETCPLNEFKTSIAEFIPNHWDVECGNVKPSNLTNSLQMDQV